MAGSHEHRLLLCGDSAGGVFVLQLPDAVMAGQPNNSEAGSADIGSSVFPCEGQLWNHSLLHHCCMPVIHAGACHGALGLFEIFTAYSLEANAKAICHEDDEQHSRPRRGQPLI